jgi:hypothetical protein
MTPERRRIFPTAPLALAIHLLMAQWCPILDLVWRPSQPPLFSIGRTLEGTAGDVKESCTDSTFPGLRLQCETPPAMNLNPCSFAA